MVIKSKAHQPNLTGRAHELIKKHFCRQKTPPLTAVDATCGNGFDTLFLTKMVTGQIYAFDIQQQALTNTRALLNKHGQSERLTLIHAGHECMNKHLPGNIDIIMFNLGYLPKADKSITTRTATSLQAIETALKLLNNNGILSILCYPGHTEGKLEADAVSAYLLSLHSRWTVQTHLSSHPGPSAPVLHLITSSQ